MHLLYIDMYMLCAAELLLGKNNDVCTYKSENGKYTHTKNNVYSIIDYNRQGTLAEIEKEKFFMFV